jgi:hypothetical protein
MLELFRGLGVDEFAVQAIATQGRRDQLPILPAVFYAQNAQWIIHPS